MNLEQSCFTGGVYWSTEASGSMLMTPLLWSRGGGIRVGVFVWVCVYMRVCVCVCVSACVCVCVCLTGKLIGIVVQASLHRTMRPGWEGLVRRCMQMFLHRSEGQPW